MQEYDPKNIEEKWYEQWQNSGYFHADENDDTKPTYSIVIPPPNVTGVLHMGHALNNTLQDIMIRYKRMDGFNTLWMPGTDHAGIATQNVVEKYLASQGKSRNDLGRDAFIEQVWEWKEKHGNSIFGQLKRLGASCDWDRARFTMDEGLSKAVRKVFVTLYNEDLIYRSDYIVNWCPRCHSALSDLEVEHEDENSFLWHMRYPLADGSGEVVVATTRPETMLGDTAVAVNPHDERYKDMIGKEVILPIVNKKIPIVADHMVDVEFGTGAVKITPAHDLNDYETGKRHDLELVVIMDPSGIMNENAGPYKGLDRFECRKQIEIDLQEQGFLVEKTEYTVPAGTCYRCKTVIEPYLSKQWFVKIKPMAEEAVLAVREGDTKILPQQWEKVYYEWMENIRDWCISRQIWWGHRIPAWFCADCGEITVSEADATTCSKCGSTNIEQDTDVLDTWFSSGLWPFSTMGWPEQTPELAKFYPTSVLITGFDILFFWVARMMMMGGKFMGEVPFKDVYLHALVRDENGQKMSKSKGNVIDPIVEMDKYGADAFRFTMTAFAAMGRDVRLSEKRIQGYRFFINKIWNAGKFVLSNIEGYNPDGVDPATLKFSPADKWILTELNKTIKDVREALDGYRFNEVADTLYHFTWNMFCSWYIELSKPLKDAPATQWTLYYVLKSVLEMLHPVIPFVTEEIWQQLPGSKPDSIMIASFPEVDEQLNFAADAAKMDTIIEVITGVRSIRGESNISPSVKLNTVFKVSDADRALIEECEIYIHEIARVADISFISGERPAKSAAAVTGNIEIYVPLEGVIDIAAELDRLNKQIGKVEKELEKKNKKLSNEGFLAKAKPEVVEQQKSEKAELEFKLEKLQQAKSILD